MHTVCPHASGYFFFYDEYGRVHYDDEVTIMLGMMHDDHYTSGRPSTAN